MDVDLCEKDVFYDCMPDLATTSGLYSSEKGTFSSAVVYTFISPFHSSLTLLIQFYHLGISAKESHQGEIM